MLCVDEKSQIQALDRTAPLLPLLPGTAERATHDYMRAGTSSLYAALNVSTGKVIGRVHSRHRANEFKQFLATLDREVPAEFAVHLVLDNYSTHKTPAMRRWLAAHPRFSLHFTPTTSSWLNLVERWFAERQPRSSGAARPLRPPAQHGHPRLDYGFAPAMPVLVVKLGSSVVAQDSGELRLSVVARVCEEVASLHRSGVDVVVVTSGAIARGVHLLELPVRRTEIAELQAASAVGQGRLYRTYDDLLTEQGLQTAQVLLTFFDMSARTHYLNARRTLQTLLGWRVVPVINENDTTTTDEISFGDNDFLAAQVAVLRGRRSCSCS